MAEIAKRAGLTERTFFRHFADKREVLFAGSEALQELLVSTVADAPASARAARRGRRGPRGRRRGPPGAPRCARQRQTVIAANAELQERELIKLASLSAALAETLRGRGVEEPAASLTAEAGIAVFESRSSAGSTPTTSSDLPALVRDSLHQVSALTAGG